METNKHVKLSRPVFWAVLIIPVLTGVGGWYLGSDSMFKDGDTIPADGKSIERIEGEEVTVQAGETKRIPIKCSSRFSRVLGVDFMTEDQLVLVSRYSGETQDFTVRNNYGGRSISFRPIVFCEK